MATIRQPHLFPLGQGQPARRSRALTAGARRPRRRTADATARSRSRSRTQRLSVRPMWNSLIVAFVFRHPSIAALRRELLRNGQLRDRCGFGPVRGRSGGASEYASTRFQRRRRNYEPQVEELLHSAVDESRSSCRIWDRYKALDGKELHSLAKGESSQRRAPGPGCRLGRQGLRQEETVLGVLGRLPGALTGGRHLRVTGGVRGHRGLACGAAAGAAIA